MPTIFITIGCVIVAVLAYTLLRLYQTNRAIIEHRLHLAEEVQDLRSQLGSVLGIIERHGGGIEKRISEHQEILAAITTRQPALFNDEPGLKYWLSANNDFFIALKSAVSGGRI